METRSKRRKRQRLISISSNVSSWPDVPARFESLNDDTLTTVLEFVGKKSYRSFGGLNKHCKEVYLNTPGMTKETFLFGYGPLSVIQDRYERSDDDEGGFIAYLCKGVLFYNRKDVLDWALQERNTYLLRKICFVAVEEERLDLLNKVWDNDNLEPDGDFEYIFEEMDEYAAVCGKLNVLKWVENKVPDIDKDTCANEAARFGHLHILQWLQEERGLQLNRELYYRAIEGGHLHVLKWLREQEVPWSEYTFMKAAIEGNINVLQWLHDEGCPWLEDDNYREYVDRLKPEALAWLRTNGYGNRIEND